MLTAQPSIAGDHATEERADRELAEASRQYERYLALAGVARIPTDLEAIEWERDWARAEREGRPVGLVIDPPAAP